MQLRCKQDHGCPVYSTATDCGWHLPALFQDASGATDETWPQNITSHQAYRVDGSRSKEKILRPEHIHPIVEVTPSTSGNEVTEGTPKHTKKHWDADANSNSYFEKFKSEFHGILLWTQHQNIHSMPKKGCDVAQIPLGRGMHVSFELRWGMRSISEVSHTTRWKPKPDFRWTGPYAFYFTRKKKISYGRIRTTSPPPYTIRRTQSPQYFLWRGCHQEIQPVTDLLQNLQLHLKLSAVLRQNDGSWPQMTAGSAESETNKMRETIPEASDWNLKMRPLGIENSYAVVNSNGN